MKTKKYTIWARNRSGRQKYIIPAKVLSCSQKRVLMEAPEIIEIGKIGDPDLGFISVWEREHNIPFQIARVFWAFDLPEGCIRGNHAHKNTQQVLICLQGIIEIKTHMPDGLEKNFVLDKPSQGLYIPPSAWHSMKYSGNAIQLVLASSLYDEKDYLRDHSAYLKYYL